MTYMDMGFSLSFEGNDADDHEIEFYDLAHALMGFQRSLALTTHLVLNGEVITQAPSLKNARILITPIEEGSVKINSKVILVAAGMFTIGTAPTDTPLGHIIGSAYDYVVSETMGFHVDYDKSLGQLYEEKIDLENSKIPKISQSQLDSVAEKCENSIKEMHRPIVFSRTAESARIISNVRGKERPFPNPLSRDTYDYLNFTEQTNDTCDETGWVSSYNINTFKGRVFLEESRRPIPFTLAESAQNARAISRITRSLDMNAKERLQEGGELTFRAYRNYSRTGRLKSLYVVQVL